MMTSATTGWIHTDGFNKKIDLYTQDSLHLEDLLYNSFE